MNMDELEDIFDEEVLSDIPDQETQVTVDIPSDDHDDFFGDKTPSENSETSILDDYLKSLGIENAKISVLDENDEEQEISFYDLTKEEQLEILKAAEPEQEIPDHDLDESEIELLNQIRESQLSVEEFLEAYKASIIDEIGQGAAPEYSIDSYDDQELYLLDLKQKFDLTDEELAKKLEYELQDEALFKKQVDTLRAEYKQLEDQYNEAQKQEAEDLKEEQFNQFSETMVNVALQTPEFYGIELDDDEKNEVLSQILDLDENGTSEFYKSLNDPKKLYELAWFSRYGKDSFDALKKAYESEISRLKKEIKPNPVAIRRNSNDKPQNSIYDLNF